MKRLSIFLLLLALIAPWAVQAQETVTIGDGTSKSYYTPFNSLYWYSFTEMIYPASEITIDDETVTGTINSVSYYLDQSYTVEQTNNIVLYMKNVTRETFASTTDYETVTASDIVFNGQWTIPANTTGVWLTITLDTPFEYDGESNLMIAMDENTDQYSTRNFRYTSVTNSGIQFYHDTYNPDPYALASFSGSKTLRAQRPNIQLVITLPSSTATPPAVTTNNTPTNLTNTSVTLGGTITDMGGATGVNAGICYSTSSTPTTSDGHAHSRVTATGAFTQDITGLLPNTTYYYRAYAYNSANSLDDPTYGNIYSFTTGGTITLNQPANGTISASVAGGAATTSNTYALPDQSVTLTATAVSGYDFDSWIVSGVTGTASGSTYTFTMPSNNVTVTANFIPTSGGTGTTIDWNLWERATSISTSETYLIGAVSGSDVYLVLNYSPVQSGYYYASGSNYWGYTAKATLDDNDRVTGCTGNATDLKYAQWKFSAETGGIITSQYQTSRYLYGTTSSSWTDLYPATSQTTWTYSNNQLSYSASGSSYYLYLNSSNCIQKSSSATTVYLYKPATVTTYAIVATANPTEGGTVSGSDYYASGTTCTLTATPAFGYDFVSWTEGGTVVSTDAEYTFTVSSARTLVANFESQGSCIKPTDVAQVANTEAAHQAQLSWTENNEATQWEVVFSTDSEFDPDAATPTTVNDNPTITISGLDQETTYYVYVRTVCGENSQSGWSNKATFTTISGRQAPTVSYDESTLTDNSVTITWTGVATNVNHQSYDLYYSTDPVMPQTPVQSSFIGDITGNSHPLTGLSGNTQYYVWVRDNCGTDGYSDWSSSFTFKTACGAMTSFPWTENFDSYEYTGSNSITAPSTYPNDPLPDCWQFLNRSTSTSTYPQAYLCNSTTYAVSGNCLFFKSSKDTPLYAVLPEFGTDIAGLELSFTYRNEGTSTSNGILYVSYMTDPNDASTFNEANAVACGQTTTKTPMEVMLANAPAGSYFAFKYQGGSSNNYYLAIDDVTVKVPVTITANQIVNTVSDPATEITWSDFVSHWNNGDHFTSTTFTLMDHITVSTMVGTSANPFTGTFNGNEYTITLSGGDFGTSSAYASQEGVSPFYWIKDARIENLCIAGNIYSSVKHAAGFCYATQGTCTIYNCRSSVNINSTASTEAGCGFVAQPRWNNNEVTTIEGCVFDGAIKGSGSQCGGFVNYPNKTVNITNCLFAPSDAMTIGSASSYMFHQINSSATVTLTNCYYRTSWGATAQGKQAYSVTSESPVTVAMAGTPTQYNVSGITAYSDNSGMLYNGTIYAGDGETVTLALSGTPGYEADHGTLTPNGENYTLVMEAYDTEISGVDCPMPFNVAVSDITNNSATITWQGNNDAYIVRYRPVVSTTVTDFTEDFSGQTAAGVSGSGQLPESWMSYNNIEGAYLPRVSNGSNYGFLNAAYPNNNNFLLLSLNSEGDDTQYIYAIMPKYNGIESVAFNYAFESNSVGTLTIGYVTDNTGYATYQALQTLTAAESKTVYDYSLTATDIATINSNNGYITFCYSGLLGGGYYSVGIDDIAVRSLAENQWTTRENVEGLSQGLSGLTGNTEYEVQVKADCGSGDEWTSSVNFTTLDDCSAPAELNATNLTAASATLNWSGVQDTYNVRYRKVITAPVAFDETYDFEDNTLQGWTTESNDADNNAWDVWSTSGYAHGGTHFARSRYTSSGYGEANDWLISPQIPLGGTFSFYARRYSTSYTDRFQVYVSTTGNNISDFTAISEVITPNSTYDLYEYNLSSYSGYGYVAIVYTAPNDQYYIYVDDIHITASIAGEYGEWNTSNTNVTSGLPINGLSYNTTYEWQVQGINASCTDGLTDWSETASFTTPYPTFTKTIEAVGNDNWAEGKGGYYLIASPLAADVDPTTITGMTTGDYDLYSFDQDPTDASGLEWRNYRASAFNLVNGQGYLYASKNGTTLTFTGMPLTGDEATVELAMTDDNTVDFQGWNLVGNPFGGDAYLKDNRSFYTMQNAGEFTSATGVIHAMDGVFVIAETNGETLTFTTTAPSKVSQLNVNLTKDNSLMDRAIVRFDEGSQLPKLQFRKGSTKVYIPQEGKDYAVVRSEEMGAMPVNFKAENDGTYTLSFTSEEVSFAYLHLIDNMTGIETDLLANPSYSFDARTTDYESRFKLVFATGNNANDDAFAFYSNGSFIINNEGNATLQVIDVNGRILKNESINGCANVNVKAAAGVYMLRLVNGNDVKVQKVVVR